MYSFTTKVFSLLIVWVITSNVNAQETEQIRRKDLSLYYSFAHIGQNISLNYHHSIGRHTFVGGLRMRLQTRVHHNNSAFDGWVFYKEYGCQRLREFIGGHMGLNFGYRYQLFKSPRANSYNPYLFYLFQPNLSMNASYDKKFSCHTTKSGSPNAVFTSVGPYFVLENVLGVGMQPKIYKRWGLDASAGITFAWFDPQVPPSPTNIDYRFWERSLAIRVGITYQIGGYEEKSPAFLDKGQFK